MSDVIRCAICQGRKKVLGAGMMEKECKDCLGIGWIKKPEENIVTEVVLNIPNDESEEIVQPGKRKYTKKIKGKAKNG